VRDRAARHKEIGAEALNTSAPIAFALNRVYCSDTSSTLNIVGNVTSLVPRN